MKVINAKDYLELQLIINYNIQYICWGLLHKASSKIYVLWQLHYIFQYLKVTSNEFFATSKTFHSPITLGHDISYDIPWYFEYRFVRIPRYIDQKNKKTGPFIKFSYWTVFPNLNVVYFEGSSRSNLSNIKFQRSNLNS